MVHSCRLCQLFCFVARGCGLYAQSCHKENVSYRRHQKTKTTTINPGRRPVGFDTFSGCFCCFPILLAFISLMKTKKQCHFLGRQNTKKNTHGVFLYFLILEMTKVWYVFILKMPKHKNTKTHSLLFGIFAFQEAQNQKMKRVLLYFFCATSPKH